MQPRLISERFERLGERFASLSRRLSDVAQADTNRRRDQIAALERLRRSLGYEVTLERGYAVVRGDGDVVTTKSGAQKAAALELEFKDGRLSVGGAPARKAKPKDTPPEQGTLL